MNVYLPAFYLGVQEELEKHSRCWEGYEPVPGKEPYSEDSCRPKGEKKKEKKAEEFSTENIFPNITNQAKWKYVRTKDGLKLTDGNLVYSFAGFPEKYPLEDTQVTRGLDDNILNLEKDLLSKGTAQIHRSSPSNVYVTLADGSLNPTFMLQHEEGKNWRYSPSKKFLAKLKSMEEKVSPETVQVDPASVIAGAEDQVKQAEGYDPVSRSGGMDSEELGKYIASKITGLGSFLGNTTRTMSDNPILSSLAGYGAYKAYNSLKDRMDPNRIAERELTPGAGLSHELTGIAAGVAPTLLARAIYAK